MRKYFEFFNKTKINCGESALFTIQKELSYYGSKKPMMLSSSNADKLGITDKVKRAISAESESEIVCFEGVNAKVDPDVVKEIKKSYVKNKCDGIIAVGGDAVMDAAKCLRFFLVNECDDLSHVKEREIKTDAPVFVVIPTENGSGKETNGYLDLVEGYISTPSLVPDVVIVDEDTIMGAPTRILAACGIYALANAIEAFLQAEEEDIAEIYAEKAIRLLANNLLNAVKDSENAEACRGTARASALAGIAYGNAPFGAAHALAEGMAEITGEPIEEMFGIALVPAMKKAKELHEDRLKKVYFEMVGPTAYAEMPDSERADKAIAEVERIIKELRAESNIPTKISETRMQRELFGAMAEAAAAKRAAISAATVAKKEDFLALLNEAY